MSVGWSALRGSQQARCWGASRVIQVGTKGCGHKGAGKDDGRRDDGVHRGCLVSAGYVGFGGVIRVQIKACG
jgi:hypothetical protein